MQLTKVNETSFVVQFAPPSSDTATGSTTVTSPTMSQPQRQHKHSPKHTHTHTHTHTHAYTHMHAYTHTRVSHSRVVPAAVSWLGGVQLIALLVSSCAGTTVLPNLHCKPGVSKK